MCKEILNRVHNGAFLIDVREPSELKQGKLPHSFNVPMREIPELASELNFNDEILLYCHSGQRSGMVESYMQEQGFKNVKNIGGILHHRDCLVY